jgi:hypothetical protein
MGSRKIIASARGQQSTNKRHQSRIAINVLISVNSHTTMQTPYQSTDNLILMKFWHELQQDYSKMYTRVIITVHQGRSLDPDNCLDFEKCVRAHNAGHNVHDEPQSTRRIFKRFTW